MHEKFDIAQATSRWIPHWTKRNYLRSDGLEIQFIDPTSHITSITFYPNVQYYEIFTLAIGIPLRLPLPRTDKDFLSDLTRSNIHYHQ